MSNVIQFPSRPSLPPTPVNALIDELTAVEIELARARLVQIRSEIRQGNALWFWYCFKRVLFWGFALWLLTHFVHAASA